MANYEQVKSAKEIQVLAVAALNVAMDEAKANCGRGVFQSRGKWVIVLRKDGGEPFLSDGVLEWKGTQKQLNALLAEYGTNPVVSGIYVEGGVNYGENVSAFSEGWYDPWVAEWSVPVLVREA